MNMTPNPAGPSTTETTEAEREAIKVMELHAKLDTQMRESAKGWTEWSNKHSSEIEVAELRAERNDLKGALEFVCGELERLKQALADDAEEDTAIRRKAATVLGNWVEGDSHEVPSLTSVVERLVGELESVLQQKSEMAALVVVALGNSLPANEDGVRARSKLEQILGL